MTISKRTVRSGGLLSKRSRSVVKSLDTGAQRKLEQKKKNVDAKGRLQAPKTSRSSSLNRSTGKIEVVKKQMIETPGALNQSRTYRGLKKQL